MKKVAGNFAVFIGYGRSSRSDVRDVGNLGLKFNEFN